MFIGAIVIFGHSLRIAESPIFRVDSTMDHTSYANCLWEVVLTMTTVGYGDYYPRTMIGRFLVFWISIYGVTIVSMMVVTISNLFQMSGQEKKAFSAITRLTLKKKINLNAAKVITMVTKIHKKIKTRQPVSRDDIIKLKKSQVLLKKNNRMYSAASDFNVMEEMLRQFYQQKGENNEMMLYVSLLGGFIIEVVKNLGIEDNFDITTKKLAQSLVQERKNLKKIEYEKLWRDFADVPELGQDNWKSNAPGFSFNSQYAGKLNATKENNSTFSIANVLVFQD